MYTAFVALTVIVQKIQVQKRAKNMAHVRKKYALHVNTNVIFFLTNPPKTKELGSVCLHLKQWYTDLFALRARMSVEKMEGATELKMITIHHQVHTDV